MKCDYCESDCHGIYAEKKECPWGALGAREDKQWIVGLAISKALNDTKGFNMDNLDYEIQADMIEKLGDVAIKAYEDRK